jgi:predicted HTH domain antitoxin
MVTLEIPREIPNLAKMSLNELKQELAFALYARNKISFGKARELADLSVWQFQDELGRRGMPPHYGTEEFADDIATLRDIGRL